MRGDYCHRYAKVWWIFDRDEGRIKLGRLRCKQWKCPYCARENQREAKQFLLTQLSKMNDREWYFMTLTARGETRGKLESYKQLAHGIDVLIKRFNRVWGKVDYVRVYEKHPKSDALHAHFLVSNLTPFVAVGRGKRGARKFTPALERTRRIGFWNLFSYVKKISHECGMGYIAHVSQVERGGDGMSNVTRYITKIASYLTKEAQDIDIKGLRHIQTSRRIGSIKRKKASSALIVGSGISYSASEGLRVIDVDTGEIVSEDYWLERGFYPPNSDRLTD